mmetsp:Transcript_38950/g.58512  ORF Transcript_38950/g.58512 Transcript_38950/m.58512 type:complete len:922 (-) Transcript_38950:312-3077(-)
MPHTNPQSGGNSSSSSSNSSLDIGSPPLKKESSSCSNAMIEKLAKRTSGLLSRTSERRKRHKYPPGVILMLERGEWSQAATRAKKYPGECKTWATIKKTSPGGNKEEDGHQKISTMSSLTLNASSSSIGTANTIVSTNTESSNATGGSDDKRDKRNPEKRVSSIKCKALHHACHRLRSIHSYRSRHPDISAAAYGTRSMSLVNGNSSPHTTPPPQEPPEEEDEWVEACKCIMTLIELHPEACGERESRHGCLPLHLAAFAMCETPPPPSAYLASSPSSSAPPPLSGSHHSPHRSSDTHVISPLSTTQSPIARPKLNGRSFSTGSHGSSSIGGMSAMISAENVGGAVGIECQAEDLHAMIQPQHENDAGDRSLPSKSAPQLHISPPPLSKTTITPPPQALSPALRQRHLKINSARRERYSLLVLNALLDAYPKGIRVDSEGGRLPLHTAVAGRATAAVISTLIQAYSAGARQRTKDGYLPLHLAAYWGVSHPEVAPMLLRAYPDATLGRNRWERTPLEEALVMAGENGRQHQIELVRALRKHPDYWARPPVEMGLMLSPHSHNSRGTPSPRPRRSREMAGRPKREEGEDQGGKHLVDVDETITDLSSDEEDYCGMLESAPSAPLMDEHDSKHNMLNRFSPTNLIRKSTAKPSHNNPQFTQLCCRSNKPSPSPLHPLMPHPYATEQLDVNVFLLLKTNSWAAILSRLESHPSEAAEIRPVTVRGGYGARVNPLYAVSERHPPLEVIESLIEACPDAASTRKVPGSQLPLHAACTWRASSGVVGFLLAAYPAGAKAKDDFANLPLHCACFSGADAQVVESLVCTYPRGVWARNGQGSTPADIVRRLRHPNRAELLDMLEKRSLDLMLKRRRKLGDSVVADEPIITDDSFDGSKQSSEDSLCQDNIGRKTNENGSDDKVDGMLWI